MTHRAETTVGVNAGDDGERLALMAAVARRHYMDRRSYVDIADEFGISRFKVARLVDASRDQGIVRIEVVPRARIDVERAERLVRRYGLQHAVVIDVAGVGVDDRRRELAVAAARLLGAVLTEDDVLGIPWSRSVATMTDHLGELPAVPVVQLTGSMDRPGVDLSTVDLVRRVAQVTDGDVWRFHAPNLLDDAVTAAGLRRQPAVAEALEMAHRVTCAVVGVGAWQAGRSSIYDAVDAATRRAVAADGVIGELACAFFGADGRPRRPDLAERMIAVDAETLQAIDQVIGIIVYPDCPGVVQAAVRDGLLTSLVIGADLADRLLEDT